MTAVVVVDDQSLVRQAVVDILDTHDDITVVGQASNGLEAVRLASTLHPDVIVMDIRMPELDGIAATAQICSDPTLAQTKVLVLTTFEEDENLISALRAGASAFVGKGAEPEDIVRAVRSVHVGDALLSPAATRALTAKTHVNRIMTKVQAHDRAQLVILAYESGLLTPGE